jgi:tetratricopeptide (TPR) repeat protein
VLSDLGNVRVNIGEYEAARRDQLAALEIAREVSDRESEAVNLDTLGLIAQQLGRHDEALALCQQALEIARAIGDRRGEGYALTHLGYSYLDRGDLAAARHALNEAIALRYELADRLPTVVDDLAALARVELGEGEAAKAFAYATEALDRLREHGPEGVEFPVRAYLVCFQVLRAIGSSEAHTRATEALEEGHALLEKSAAQIQDTRLRESYLANVPFNRDLRVAYSERVTKA